MQFDKRLVVAIPLGLLVWLLNIYIDDLYHWLTDDYVTTLELKISYKVLFQICIGLLSGILVCLAWIIFLVQNGNSNPEKPSVPRNFREPSKSEQQSLMEYLDTAEKQLLSHYISGDTKRLLLNIPNPTASGLVTKRMLFIPRGFTFPDITGKDALAQFTMHEWAWRYLKQHPKTIK